MKESCYSDRDVYFGCLLVLFVLGACDARSGQAVGTNDTAGTRAAKARGQERNSPNDDSQSTIIVLPIESAQHGAWGAAISSPQVEAQVLQIVRLLGQGSEVAVQTLDDIVVVGPALWNVLSAAPELQSLGTPSQVVVGSTVLDMRTMLDADAKKAFVGNGAFQQFMGKMGKGVARPANNDERRLFYAMIPFEIAGAPLTVIDLGEQHLVVSLSGGKVTWIDLISGYKPIK